MRADIWTNRRSLRLKDEAIQLILTAAKVAACKTRSTSTARLMLRYLFGRPIDSYA